ncbi:carboxylesterase [Phlyctema vagabunda]|uniref:Carboxylic ester hydrolase n=1 Tax=Phlyctema vagabunda TaxID=108571 RepID=A0ABR4PID6_9HELO
MLTSLTYLVLAAAGICSASPTVQVHARDTTPTVTLKNGTYTGRHNSYYNQDYFLGVPFALPPVNDLRFRAPQSLNTTWSSAKPAVTYPPLCVGYGTDVTFNTGIDPPGSAHRISEDCLYLNVVKPSTATVDSGLPVAVWIHGGGLYQGGSDDQRYNLSYIVQNSVDLGQPMIGISIQYRLSGWGFLVGKEALEGGAANNGYRDQRLALHWIQENIAAFGGDPTKVTIWGESAGGLSVGAQLLAYNGRDDGLFRAAISQSGGPATQFFDRELVGGYNTTAFQTIYNNLLANTSCASSANTSSSLDCLRALPYEDLNTFFNSTQGGPFFGMIDGDFIATWPSDQLNAGNFVRVPYLAGTNSDEGAAFGASNISTDAEFLEAVNATTYSSPLAAFANTLVSYLYPDIQAIGTPSFKTLPEVLTPESNITAKIGLQARRSYAFFADQIVNAPRRASNLAWSNFNVPSYSYRFDVTVNGLPAYVGATHFQEVAFVFDNINGLGYATSPFPNSTYPEKKQAFENLASHISRSWVGFITQLDPNANGLPNVATWPVFNATSGGGAGKNIVFSADVDGFQSFPEDDTYRAEGMQFISDHAKSVWGR